METIKEMAVGYAENFVLTVDHKGDVEESYTDGANAVLEKVEDVLGLLPDTTAKRVVANKIKELKGEK